MKKWLAFLLAVLVLTIIHEGIHVLLATYFGEYKSAHLIPIGIEIRYKTASDERSGIEWTLISGISNLVTLFMGYWLLILGKRFARVRNGFFKASIFYLTVISLLADPLNLSVGAFIYGGDANGVAAGLGINRYAIQAIFLVVLLVNRELVAQKLFPLYNIQTRHILFRPLIGSKNRTQGMSI